MAAAAFLSLALLSACSESVQVSAATPPSPSPSLTTTTMPRSTTLSTSPSSGPTVGVCPPELLVEPNAWTTAADDALKHEGFAGVELSASVWVEGVGEVVAVNADKALFPASNQKLLTAVGAYMLMDPDHRFSTFVELVESTLVLRAGGDPTLRADGAHSLDSLATQLSTAELPEVDGLVIDASHFESAVTVAGRQPWQLPTYTGPMSAFIVDDNRWRKDDEFIAAPALQNAELFAKKLRSFGVRIPQVTQRDGFLDNGEIVAQLDSDSVSNLITAMLLSSDNEIAESLLREIGNGSTADGIAEIESALAGTCPEISGRSGDGSGLSRANLRPSREWRQLLQFAVAQPWGDDFMGSLPIAGRSGTLARRLTGVSTRRNVKAKTGTIIGGRSLSGFGTTPDGRQVVFSIVTNGEPESARSSLAAIDSLVTAVVGTNAGR